MRTPIYTLCLLLLPFLGLAQQNEAPQTTQKEQTTFNNQVDLDVHLFGVEYNFKRRISEKMFVGFGLSCGFITRIIIQVGESDPVTERLRLKGFLAYQLSRRLQVQLGGSYSFASYNFNTYENRGTSIGFPFALLFKLKKLELGIEPSIIFFKDEDNSRFEKGALTTTILFIKIPLDRW